MERCPQYPQDSTGPFVPGTAASSSAIQALVASGDAETTAVGTGTSMAPHAAEQLLSC